MGSLLRKTELFVARIRGDIATKAAAGAQAAMQAIKRSCLVIILLFFLLVSCCLVFLLVLGGPSAQTSWLLLLVELPRGVEAGRLSSSRFTVDRVMTYDGAQMLFRRTKLGREYPYL